MRPFGKNPEARAATAPRPARAPKQAVSNLLLMTCLGAVDGTVLLMAAAGALQSVGAAVVVGLTVVSGAGAWIAAYQAFGGRHRTAADYRLLAGIALLSVTATVAAAWVGMALGEALRFHVLPKAVGVVLFLVAAEVAGLRLPRPGRAPLPVVALAAAGLLEVAHWIP